MVSVSDCRWWAWRVEGLAKAAKWEQVLQMACSTKSPPIGFIPFVSAAARYTGGDAYMARLLERVPPADQIQARVAARDLIGAAELAVARKDTRALEMVRHSAFGQRELYAKIGDMLTALTST